MFFDIFDSVLGNIVLPTNELTIKAYADILFFAVKSDSIPVYIKIYNS